MDIELEILEEIDFQPSEIPNALYNSDINSLRWSNKGLTSGGIEMCLDEMLSKLNNSSSNKKTQVLNTEKKKRGRKPIRPNDPIKKKTEEKDKYWLRGFRGYMKTRYVEISHTLTDEEKIFWLEHLSPKGVPDKGNVFSSYGKRYKNYLFSQSSFVNNFQEWFIQYGEVELARKCSHGSDLWFVFFDYASKELLNYVPKGCSSIDGINSPKSPASPGELNEELNKDDLDFSLVEIGNEEFEHSYLD